MVETLCTSGAVKHRAGKYASTDVINSGAWITELINQAEGCVVAETGCDWVSIYSSMSANYKKVIENTAAVRAALMVIPYDTTGYLNTPEGAFMENVLWAEYSRNIKVLSDPVVIKRLGGTLLA